MSDLSSSLSFDNVRFEEASKYFADRVIVTPSEFYKISDDYRSLAFTVGGYVKTQILKKFHDELLIVIDEGISQQAFRDRMNEFLSEHGYAGITPFQADNIFRTNIQTAYQVGHYKQMTSPMVKKLRPYWQYDAVNDRHTRPSHLAMDGKVFPADSPIWDTWYPPNGFRCRCSVSSLSQRQVEEYGLYVEDSVPKEIAPDTNFSTNRAKVKFSPDLAGYPDVLVKAYQKMQSQNKIEVNE